MLAENVVRYLSVADYNLYNIRYAQVHISYFFLKGAYAQNFLEHIGIVIL